MSKWQFTKGLHELGNGCYAYLQPDGSWGWSNAGLIVDGEANLLVDTLFDLKLTREMLDTMRDAVPPAARSASWSTPTPMATTPSATSSSQDARSSRRTAPRRKWTSGRRALDDMITQELARSSARAGRSFYEIIGRNFDFDDIVWTLPTETFDDETDAQGRRQGR